MLPKGFRLRQENGTTYGFSARLQATRGLQVMNDADAVPG